MEKSSRGKNAQRWEYSNSPLFADLADQSKNNRTELFKPLLFGRKKSFAVAPELYLWNICLSLTVSILKLAPRQASPQRVVLGQHKRSETLATRAAVGRPKGAAYEKTKLGRKLERNWGGLVTGKSPIYIWISQDWTYKSILWWPISRALWHPKNLGIDSSKIFLANAQSRCWLICQKMQCIFDIKMVRYKPYGVL